MIFRRRIVRNKYFEEKVKKNIIRIKNVHSVRNAKQQKYRITSIEAFQNVK